jgi:[acyl-carrier-protein] S-malonyltransferase
MKTCLVFPGQGAQYPGMGQDLYEASEAVQELFTLAAETTGIDVKALLFEGSEEELKKTENTQVAITLVNLAVAEFLGKRGS